MRIGINIPNHLHRRLEPVKQYVNVSQICREAIEDRIRCYERAVESLGNGDIVKAMDRTWKEERELMAVVEVDWGMCGLRDAESWVEAAGLRDWNYLHHRQEVIDGQGRPRWDVPPPYLDGVKTFDDHYTELLKRIREQDDQFLDWLYDEHGGLDREMAQREYMSAWLACTDSAWNLLHDMRGRYTEERRREQAQEGSNRPKPTFPQKLLRELGAVDKP